MPATSCSDFLATQSADTCNEHLRYSAQMPFVENGTCDCVTRFARCLQTFLSQWTSSVRDWPRLDGTNNAGREITRARDEAVAKGVTINGLAILSEVPLATNPLHTNPPGGLPAYYENNVIGGPGAFEVEAQSFEAFGQLLIGKLIKEIVEVPRRRL
jgi:hypothetical protein